MAKDIGRVLKNFDSLTRQCNDLFDGCKFVEADGSKRIAMEQLHNVTQRLIDQFGCRSPPVLERIGHIYDTAASGSDADGIGIVEFRGYVASVLTQILRELEHRRNTNAQQDIEYWTVV